MSDQNNLELLLSSHFPLIVIESHEETRALGMLEKMSRENGTRMLRWTVTKGLVDTDYRGHQAPSAESWDVSVLAVQRANASTEPEEMLKRIHRETRGSIIVLVDFHPYLDDPQIIRLIKDAVLLEGRMINRIVFISSHINIPRELIKLCAHVTLSLPDPEAIRELVLEEARAWSMQNHKKVKTDKRALDLLIRNLAGLTYTDARRLVRNAIYLDGAITHSDVKGVMAAKYQLAEQEGVLSFEYDTAHFSEIGGFEKLKQWLNVRRKSFIDSGSNRLDVPKGMLMLGVQGCGKSLAAKAVAGVWGVPLLRLDFGGLYDKYIGETEKNIREALKTAETMSPCVLWIDEIEKGIQTSSGEDGGVSRRVLGTLLTWMSEKHKPVFLVATANDISALPPELVRKGRMDEIFFVDLPESDARKRIFEIHLRQRKQDVNRIDMESIVQASQGFSGAEIEQAIVSAQYSADADTGIVTTANLLSVIEQTRPLSVLMAEKVTALREWAHGRTVSVD